MKKVAVPKRLKNDVRDIFLYQNSSDGDYSDLPFYADGYPGIVYIESEEAYVRLPDEKELSHFFMYGQTEQPISIKLKNPFLLLVFRIDQMTGYHILNSDSSELVNDCLDLDQKLGSSSALQFQYLKKETLEHKIETIANYISEIKCSQDENHYTEVQKAIRIILEKDGNVSIKNIHERLYVSERTFQRQFQKIVGVTPKQLALIIRYHTSKKKYLSESSAPFFDVIGESSYTDQSHFIKQFKRYSGKTPAEYLKNIKSIGHQPLD